MKRILFFALYLAVTTTYIVAQDTQLNDSISDSQIDLNADFYESLPTKSMADSAYMDNDYATAIQIYETLLTEGDASEIYYNLGNSYYKSGNIAKAILNYERALLLSPGNSDIKFNLEIARSKTVDRVEEIPDIFFIGWIKSLINIANVNTWAKWGIVFFILFLTGLYFFIFSTKINFKKAGFISAIVFLLFTICSNTFALYQKKTLINRNTAIIISPSVTIRSTPNENGTNLFILHEGRKVVIKDNSMKNWKEISLEDGKVGWVAASDIEII